MEYSNPLFEDFAQRTQRNLEFIRMQKEQYPDLELFEVTQLINSLLGLLIFPQQQYYLQIPQTPLDELKEKGWPIPRVKGNFPQVSDLRQLLRYLRNTVAHSNLEFQSDENKQTRSVELWNEDNRISGRDRTTWRAELTVDDLDQLVQKFLALILESEQEY